MVTRKRQTINDEDRRQWCENDEGLYNSGYSKAKDKAKWINENRELIDSVIRNVTEHKKPAHYLAYSETERNQF